MRLLRSRAGISVALLALLPLVAEGRTRALDQTPTPQPRLVLALSVDQMRFDYLTRFKPLFRAGLRVLLERGAVFSRAMYRHANTETGPGHSVLLSGRDPSHSGIVANDWWDPLAGRRINVVDDPVQSTLGGPGRAASPANFLGFTVGDMLKKQSPASRVVGVSLKDRSAVLMAGRRGDAAYWYEVDGGNFITSTYYMKTVPAWLEAWNRRRVPDSYATSTWNRLIADEALYRRYAGEDAVEGEWDRKDTVFPHAIRGRPPARQYYDDLRRTPFADEMTLSVALEAMKAYDLGRDDATDLLAVGFSATDVIGHTYGADSQEVMDQLLRLDVTLGRLLEEVERQAGPGRTLVVLSADHGSLPLVEVLQGRGIGARRVLPAVLESAVRNALAERFAGAQDLIADADLPNFYLDLEAIRRRGLSRLAVEETVEKALLSTGLVESVYTHARLMGDPPPGDPYFQLFRNAFFAPRSPHIMARIGEYVYLSDRPGGTGHGTAYERDRQVPIVFMGSGITAGTYAEPCGPEDIAPTLGKILGLDYPLQDAQRVLTEMFQQGPRPSAP